MTKPTQNTNLGRNRRRPFAGLLLAIALAGCSYENYPDDWPPRRQRADACAAFSGSYANKGFGADKEFKESTRPKLHKFLFKDPTGLGEVDRIKMEIGEDRVLRVRALRDLKVVGGTEYSEKDSTLICDESGAKIDLYRGPSYRKGSMIVGYEFETVTLSKATDGSLAVKKSTGVYGLVLFVIPVGGEDEKWYRFPPFQ